MARIDPSIYKGKIKFTYKDTKVLHARAKNAIYGAVQAAYLFWLKLTSSLKKWSFVKNLMHHEQDV